MVNEMSGWTQSDAENKEDLEEAYRNLCDEFKDMKIEMNKVRKEKDALQVKLDYVMLEYCAEDITSEMREEIEEWARHQRKSKI